MTRKTGSPFPDTRVEVNIPPTEAIKGSLATALAALQYAVVAAVATKDARVLALAREGAEAAWAALLPVLERVAQLEHPPEVTTCSSR